MAGEMFGSPIGQHIAEGDIARMSMLPLQMQQLQDQHDLAPFRAGQYAANARLGNAKARGLEDTIDMQRRIAARVAGEPPAEDGEAPKNPIWDFARAAMIEGSPELATKYADKAANIDSKLASADTAAARQALIQGRSRIVNMDNLSRDMRGVADAAGLQTALAAHEQRTGEKTGMLDREGILLPQVADQWETTAKMIQERALSEKDRTQAVYRNRALTSLEARRTAQTQNEKFWQDMNNHERRAAAQAKGRGAKNGAGTITNADFLRGATDYVSTQLVLPDTNQAKVYGREISERAKQLRDANPALTPQEAIKQVFEQMEKGGKFEGMKRRPPQASPTKPLALPTSGKLSDLRVGHYYTDASGQVRQWLGPDKKWGSAIARMTGKGDTGNDWSGPIVSGKVRGASATADETDLEMDDELEDTTLTDDDEEE